MSDILVAIIILVILGGAFYKLYRNKKNNIKSSACSACPLKDQCQNRN